MKAPIEVLLDRVDWKVLASPRTRNSKTPYATHEGILWIGDVQLKVYQLADGRRVINADDVHRFFNVEDAQSQAAMNEKNKVVDGFMRSAFWGVFQTDDDLHISMRRIHVAPCDEEGALIDGHELNEACACSPWCEGAIIVHQRFA